MRLSIDQIKQKYKQELDEFNIQDMKVQLGQKDEQITVLKVQLEQKDKEIKNMKSILKQKDEEMAVINSIV